MIKRGLFGGGQHQKRIKKPAQLPEGHGELQLRGLVVVAREGLLAAFFSTAQIRVHPLNEQRFTC